MTPWTFFHALCFHRESAAWVRSLAPPCDETPRVVLVVRGWHGQEQELGRPDFWQQLLWHWRCGVPRGRLLVTARMVRRLSAMTACMWRCVEVIRVLHGRWERFKLALCLGILESKRRNCFQYQKDVCCVCKLNDWIRSNDTLCPDHCNKFQPHSKGSGRGQKCLCGNGHGGAT